MSAASPAAPAGRRLLAYVLMLLSVGLVGASVPVSKLMLAVFPVFLFSAIRFTVAVTFSVPLALREGPLLPRLNRREWLLMGAQVVTGTLLFNLFMMYGLKLTDSVSTGIILATIPAAGVLGGVVVLGERPTRWQVAAIVLSFAGLVLVNLAAASGATGTSLLGNLLIVAAVITEAGFLLASRALTGRLPGLQQTALLNVGALCLFLPMAIWQAQDFDFGAPTALDWIITGLHGLGVSLIAVLLWYRALRDLTANEAAPFFGVVPTTAAAVGIIFLGEALTPLKGIGMVLTLAAIVVGSRGQR